MYHVQGRIPSAPQPRVMALPSLVIFAPKDVDRRRAKAIRPSGSRVVVEPRVAHLQRGPSPGRKHVKVATTDARPSRSCTSVCGLDRSIATTMSRCTGYFIGRCVPANRAMHFASRPYPPADAIGESFRWCRC